MTRHTKTSTTPGYLMTHEAAAILTVSPKTVSRWAKEGRLSFQRTLGGHRRFPEADVRALLEANTFPADPPPGTPGY